VGQDIGADGPDQVDGGVGDDPGGVDDLVAAVFRAVVKLARSGSRPGWLSVASTIAVRSTW
jgi:hypothetical protein